MDRCNQESMISEIDSPGDHQNQWIIENFWPFCENVFDLCCSSSQPIVPSIDRLSATFNNNQLNLDHILPLIDSSVFQLKYQQQKCEFNFDHFFSICQTLHANPKGALAKFADNLIAKRWKINVDFQFDFIKYCLAKNHLATILEACDGHNSKNGEALQKEISDCVKCFQNDSTESLACWKYRALYRILLELSKEERLVPGLEQIFQRPLEKCPDLLIFGLIECSQINCLDTPLFSMLMMEAIKKVIYPASNSSYHGNAPIIIQKLWCHDEDRKPLNINQKLLLRSLVQLYNESGPEDQTNKLLRILEITQDIKALNYLLNDSSYLFVIDLASVASRREYLKLDKWINDKLSTLGQPFADACKHYIQQRLSKAENGKKPATPSHVETLSIILCCLQNYLNNDEKSTYSSNMKDVFKIYSHLDPECSVNDFETNNNNNNNNNNDHDQDDQEQQQQQQQPTRKVPGEEYLSNHGRACNLLQRFPADIQAKSYAYLKKIFSQFTPNDSGGSFEKILNFFEKMHQSKDGEENEIMDCIVETLVKELDYLSLYPTNELMIIAELVGGIINRNLIKSNLFTVVLQKLYYMINSSKNEKDSNLFLFAMRTLRTCQPRLRQYPSLCEKLTDTMTDSVGSILFSPVIEDAVIDAASSEAMMISEEKLDCDSELMQRLNFVFNNLTVNNLNLFAMQFKQEFHKKQFNEYLSDCLTCRAINQVNHHPLFFELLQFINSSQLYDLLVLKCYEKIKRFLLNIDLEKRQLCSAGQWLGTITLQRNKPILSLYLDLHSLIVEADRKNCSFTVVPFVVRVLGGCALSKVFKPPNPWLMSLLRLLMANYTKVDCKLKIKFEIESLLSVLQLNLDEFLAVCQCGPPPKPVTIIEEYLKTPETTFPNDQDKYLDVSGGNRPTNQPGDCNSTDYYNSNEDLQTGQFMMMMMMMDPDHHHSPEDAYDEQFKNLLKDIRITTDLNLTRPGGHQTAELMDLMGQQIVLAVRHWIATSAPIFNMILNSIEILIKKDFACQTNVEQQVKQAIITMTRYFFAGLILVNCRQTLPTIMASKIVAMLKAECPNIEEILVNDVVQRIIDENMNCCVRFIQKLFVQKAIQEMLSRFRFDFTNPLVGDQASIILPSDHHHHHRNIYNSFDVSLLIPNDTEVVFDPAIQPVDHSLAEANALAVRPPMIDDHHPHAGPVNEENCFVQKVQILFKQYFDSFHGINNHNSDGNNSRKTAISLELFDNEEVLYSFLKICFEMCYTKCKQAFRTNQSSQYFDLYMTHFQCFALLDAFTDMVMSLIKYQTIEYKINVLDRVLTDLSTQIHLEHKSNPKEFYPVCYYRIIVIFFLAFTDAISLQFNQQTNCPVQLSCSEQFFGIKLHLVRIFYDFLKSTSPLNLPWFTLAWLEFISHRSFIGFCLSGDNCQQFGKLYCSLLADLLEFQKPFWQNDELFAESFKLLHKGTFKLFVLLLHDFPDFLSHFCFLICDNLPNNAFQFRNIVLSAFPSNLSLPDPSTTRLTMDSFNQYLYEFKGEFSAKSQFKVHIDVYFQTGKLFHLKKLPPYFESAKSFASQIEYMNRILYSISEHVLKQNRCVDLDQIAQELSVDMIKLLLDYFDAEHRYCFFGAMVNHLRYPNVETKYFICLFLHLFKEHPMFREYIMRVLLERSFVCGPLPWGVLFVLSELYKNPVYHLREFFATLNCQARNSIARKLAAMFPVPVAPPQPLPPPPPLSSISK